MQTTSQTWKDLWASGTARLEARAIIAGVEYTDISAPVINRALMQGGLSIGNAVSATCSFSVRNPGTIPKSAEVIVQKRLTDGTQTSEWLTCGTFYVSHRRRDPVTGTLELECYDALLKANADMPALMPWTTKGGEPMRTASGELLYFSAHYPRTMAAVMADIALILGGAIRIDPATQIETGAAYTIDEMQRGTRIVDVLRKIAAANGGNWIMTPQNTLKLVPVISAAGAASATANVVDVDGVVGGIGVSNTGTITGIRYTADGGQQVAGDESGIVLDADVSEDVAEALLTKLGGMTYQAYTLSGAVYDPAAELGDYIRAGAGGEVSAVIYAETATLGPAFRGDVSAPEIGELADEYPYLGGNAQLLTLAQQYADAAAQQAETSATAAAQQAVTTLDNSLTQQEIFDRLTNDGQEQGIVLQEPLTSMSADVLKKVYINLNYATIGKLRANMIYGDTLTLGGANNANGQIAMKNASGAQVGTWDNTHLQLGVEGNYVQLYGPATYNGVTAITPFYAVQTYEGGSPFEMMMKQAMLILIRGTMGLQLSPDGISLTQDDGNGFEAYMDIAQGYIQSIAGDLDVIADAGDLGLYGDNVNIFGALRINGTPGASGTFTTANGKTVTVTNGIITAIT